jgi:hypothetical protein
MNEHQVNYIAMDSALIYSMSPVDAFMVVANVNPSGMMNEINC